MITCTNEAADYATRFSNGRHQGICDAPVEKGGADAGFRPLELLEAGLAGCLNIWLRMYAGQHQIPLEGLTTEVSLNRHDNGDATFAYAIHLRGALTEAQRAALLEAVHGCPVHQALSGKIAFQLVADPATSR
jgi:putative redox protein